MSCRPSQGHSSAPFWKLTREHSLCLVRCGLLAQVVYQVVLWLDLSVRTTGYDCSLGEVVRAYQETTTRRTKHDRIKAALRKLEDVGLLDVRWSESGRLEWIKATNPPRESTKSARCGGLPERGTHLKKLRI